MSHDPEKGWYVDPLARHAHRYWSGTHWTKHVADGGQPGIDPLGSTPTAASEPAAAPVAAPAPAPASAPVAAPVPAPASAPVAAPVPAPATAPVTAPAAAPVPVGHAAPAGSGARSRTPLLIGGAMVAAAALVLAGVVLFTGGSDDGPTAGSGGAGDTERGETVVVDSTTDGEIITTDGVRLAIPAGAIPTTESGAPGAIAFSVDVVDDLGDVDTSNLPPDISIADTVYEFGPTGQSFQTPVEIEIPLASGVDPATVGGLAYFDAGTQSWQQVTGTVDPETNVVRGNVLHFSPYTYWFHNNTNGADRQRVERERGGYISVTNTATNYGWRDFPSGLFGYDAPKYPYTTTSYGVCIASWELDDPTYETQMSWYGGADRPLTVEARPGRGIRAASGGTVDFWLPAGTYQLEEVWFPSEINWGADPLYVPLVGSAHRPYGELVVRPGDRHEFVEEARVPFPTPDSDWQIGRTDCVPTVTPVLGTGNIQVTLNWPESGVDLDLHVTDPNGDEIYYDDKVAPSGGVLDQDNRRGNGIPENIFWTDNAPAGEYLVEIVNFKNSNPTPPARWTVSVLVDGQRETFSGTITYSDRIQVTTFRID
jgi:hypothetical protein